MNFPKNCARNHVKLRFFQKGIALAFQLTFRKQYSCRWQCPAALSAPDAWQVAQTPLDVRQTERHEVPPELLDPEGVSTQKLRRPPWADTMER